VSLVLELFVRSFRDIIGLAKPPNSKRVIVNHLAWVRRPTGFVASKFQPQSS